MDIHICGTCRSQFSTIEDFINHKNVGCCTNSSNNLPAKQNVSVSMMPAQTSNEPCQQEIDVQHGSARVSSTASVMQVNLGSGDCLISSTSQEPDKNVRKKAKNCKKQCADSSTRAKQKKVSGEKAKMKQYLKQFKCTFESCKFVTAHRKDLLRHERIHTGEKPYACRFCQNCFSRDDKRKLHERTHTNEKPFKCQFCDYVCAYGGSMKKHMRIHTDERPFQCQLCSYASRNSSQLMVHLRRHTGDSPFHCQRCNAKFKTNTDLKRHVLIHTGEKRFSCEQCSYRSHLKCNLKSHIASNHQGKLKYQCEHCTFKCRTKRQLSRHLSNDHVGTKFQCNECLYTASGRAALDRHMRKHSSTGPFTCKYCQYTAKRDGTITAHIKKKHPENVSEITKTALKVKIKPVAKELKESKLRDRQRGSVPTVDGKRPYKCADCDASFVRKDSFRSHRRQHDQNRQMLENAAYAVLELQDLPDKSGKQSECCVPVDVLNVVSDEVVTSDSTSVRNQRDAILVTDKQPVSSHTDISESGNNFSGISAGCRMDNTNTSVQDTDPTVEPSFSRTHILSPPGQLPKGSTAKATVLPMQTFEIIQGIASPTSVNPLMVQNPSAEAIINVLSGSDNNQLTQCSPDLTQIPLENCGGLSTDQNNSSESTSMQKTSNQASKPSIEMQNSCLVTVQNPNAVCQEQAECRESGNAAVIQTQTLGYGTSNIPVLFTSLTSSSQPSPSLSTAANSSQSMMTINSSAAQGCSQGLETMHGNIAQPSNVNVVSMENLNIGGSETVHLIYANTTSLARTITASSVLQISSTQHGLQERQLQQQASGIEPQLHVNSTLTTLPSKVAAAIPCKILPTTRATSNFDNRVASSTAIGTTQPQRPLSLQTSSVPTGSFILNGRALSRGTPAPGPVTAPGITTPSQTPQ